MRHTTLAPNSPIAAANVGASNQPESAPPRIARGRLRSSDTPCWRLGALVSSVVLGMVLTLGHTGVAAAQSAVLFQSQPQIPSAGNCRAGVIPKSAVKGPGNASDRAYAAFFGRWCRLGPNGNEEIAVVANEAFQGTKTAHTVQLLISEGGKPPTTVFGVIFWDTRQNRWSLFTGGHIAWLQRNGTMAFGVARKSGNNFRVAKGQRAQWGAYRKAG